MAGCKALYSLFATALRLPVDADRLRGHILRVGYRATPREDVVGGDVDEEDAEALGELRETCYGEVVDFVRLLGLVFGTVDSGVGRTVDDDFDALSGSELLDSRGVGEVKCRSCSEVIVVGSALAGVLDAAPELA